MTNEIGWRKCRVCNKDFYYDEAERLSRQDNGINKAPLKCLKCRFKKDKQTASYMDK